MAQASGTTHLLDPLSVLDPFYLVLPFYSLCSYGCMAKARSLSLQCSSS